MTTHSRAGVVYAVLAAASAAILLFLPVLLLGFSVYVVAAVARGEGLNWQSGVGMTYFFIGILAFVGLALLVIPYALFRAAVRRVGNRQAVRWVGGWLVVWHAGLALIWAWSAVFGPIPAAEGDAMWYAIAFGLAAIVILIATVVVEKQARGAAVALVGLVAAGLVALAVAVAAVWGTPLRIPTDAQAVHIVITESAVRLDPATVHAGEIYLVVDELAPTGHAQFTFVSRGYEGQIGGDPFPMSDEDVARLAQGDYQGTAQSSGWSGRAKFTLREGNYVFLLASPGGDQPGAPPRSIAVLEVLP